jgi:hypothetical protein
LAAVIALGAAVALAVTGSAAMADNGRTTSNLRVRLTGYQEGPAVSTAATGQFRAVIDEKAQEITYQLSYSGLEGSVTQSHIHIGLRAQNGGIMVFLCSNLGNGPEGTQACPAAPATITGTLRPGDIVGPAGQGITTGEFDELVAAIRADATYVNVHSSLFPTGEIRAQLDHGH